MQSYIYAHVNPETGEVLYIGQGQGYRAWDSHRRNHLHHTFMENLAQQGYAPTEWGVILCAGLSVKEARAVETLFIQQLRPAFNQMGLTAANAGRGTANKNAVLNDELVRLMRAQHAAGEGSIRAIGRRHSVLYSTARKAILGLGWTHVA